MKKPVVDYRQFRLSKINEPRFAHLKLFFISWIGYFTLYFLTENLIPVERCHPMHCFLDDLIPFLKEDPDSAPWVVFRADKDNFSTLSHRDYLGSLTGIGIKREKLGDIIVDSGGCSFFAKPEIASYIESEFTSAGRGTLKVRRLPCFNDFSYSKNTKEKLCFVSSLRLDCVVSAVFSLSRTKASDFIEKGLTFVNDINILKPDYKVKENDKIVIKGIGRAVLKDGSSKSKKGRVALTAEIFI